MDVANSTAGLCDSGSDAFLTALRLVQSDFLEVPGLLLTQAQASRLWVLEPGLCEAVLNALVETRFLMKTERAGFARAQESPSTVR